MKRNSDSVLDWRLVVGLAPWRDRDLVRARVGILYQFAERANAFILAQFLAAVITLKAFWPTASGFTLAALGLMLMLCTTLLNRLKNSIEQGLTQNSFAQAQWRLGATCLALGLTWSSGTLLLSPADVGQGQYVSYALLTGLMSVAALSLGPIPLAAIAYITGLGIGGILLGWQIGSVDMTFLMCMFTLGMNAASYSTGQRALQRLHGERRLAEQEEVVRLLLGQSNNSGGDVLWEVDAARRLENISHRFAEFFGYTADALHGKILPDLFTELGTPSAEYRLIVDSLRGQASFHDLLLSVTVNGEERWCELSATARYDERKRFIGFRGVLSDVTNDQQFARNINRMARYDALTSLPNRAHINEMLQETVLSCQRQQHMAAFMMIDLDRFKAVNDTLGHPVGDKLLEQVAERLTSALRPDEMAGRLGGDEFAVLLRRLPDIDRLDRLADEIIASLSLPYRVGEHTLFIGASIGSAICPKDGHVADKLVRNADLALYKAKEEGRGVHRRYEPALYTRAEERRTMEAALRVALARGELSLEYQPIVSVHDRRIIGCEALLRWHHPELGIVPPDRFIPVAEEARLISRIGEWVMRTACMEAADWPPHVHVAVNLSAEQFLDKHLYETIFSALSHSGLHPERLELEVAESVFLKERPEILETLDKLINLGVRVSLDDFGTSYSSLAFLGRTRFSTIKIDRRYVRDAGQQTRESQAVIRAVVAMAESLGMNITAEGAENDEELAMVRSLGCDQAQGYLFSRPLSAQDMLSLFDEQDAKTVSSAG